MKVALKLLGFAALLVLAFGAAALAGAAIGPSEGDGASEAGEVSGDHAGQEPEAGHSEHGATEAPAGEHRQHGAEQPAAGGLAVSDGDYDLQVERTSFVRGEPAKLAFRIADAGGAVLRDEFELEHGRELHLIVVRRDTTVYQHLHPRKRSDGTWAIELELPHAGVYRMYADFQIEGEAHTLATDLFVPGEFRPRPLPAPATTASAGAYQAELSAGQPTAGSEASLRFAIDRAGRPVAELEDYLGAKGHLVALREGDLAYLHVHPEGHGPARAGSQREAGTSDDSTGHGSGEASAGHGQSHAHGGEQTPEPRANEVAFAATFPTAGRYRLFLQFKVDGSVRTVAYTVEVAR